MCFTSGYNANSLCTPAVKIPSTPQSFPLECACLDLNSLQSPTSLNRNTSLFPKKEVYLIGKTPMFNVDRPTLNNGEMSWFSKYMNA